MNYHDALIDYLCLRFTKFDKNKIRQWIPDIDNCLLSNGWITESLIEDRIIISIFTLFRNMTLRKNINSKKFKILFHSILFVILSNCGPEITYSSKKFIKFNESRIFFDQCLDITEKFHLIIHNLSSNNHFFLNEKNELTKFIK